MEERIQRLEKLARLLEKGAITPEEFAAEKAKVLGMESPVERPSETKFEDAEAGEAHATDDGEEQRFGTASPASDAYLSQGDDDDNVQDGQENGSDLRRWAKWPALVVAIIGIVWILAKFGTAIAIIVALVGIVIHIYSRANDDLNAKPLAFGAYGLAVAVFFMSMLASSFLPRPSQTELTESQYESDCGGEKFETDCRGKFVLWEGVLEDEGFALDDGAFRIETSAGSFDLYDADLQQNDRFEGMRVRFSGYVEKQNAVYDDISDGEILAVLNTPAEVQSEKIKNGSFPSSEWCGQRKDQYWSQSRVQFECSSVSNNLDRLACEGRTRSFLQNCGIEVDLSN